MLLLMSSVFYDQKHGHVLLILMGKIRIVIHAYQRRTLSLKNSFGLSCICAFGNNADKRGQKEEKYLAVSGRPFQ